MPFLSVLRKHFRHDVTKLVGRNINVMLTALPANKRKLKFHTEEEAAKKGGTAASSELASEEQGAAPEENETES